MAQLVLDYIDKIDSIQDVIRNDADTILDAIDLDELLKDPEKYLLALGDAFLNEHIDEIEQASKEGKKFANKILNTL